MTKALISSPFVGSQSWKVALIRYLGPFIHSDIVNGDVPSDCSLWIGDIATGKITQITSNTNAVCDREVAPRWSPDGSKIAYFRERIDNSGVTDAIFVIDANGGQEQQLTNWDLVASSPDWSPDGKWIVFATHPLFSFNFDPVVSNLYRMHPDGSEMEQLTFYTTPKVRANQPQYTPGGKWIIFTAVTSSSRSLGLYLPRVAIRLSSYRGNLYSWHMAALNLKDVDFVRQRHTGQIGA